jgi:hypothetical protein
MKPFSQLSTAQKALDILRWLCLLPAAWLASQIPFVVFALVTPPALAQPGGFQPAPPISDFRRYVAPWLVALLTAPLFVLVGSLVAPRYRRTTAALLALLWTAYAFLSHIYIHLPGTPHYLHFTAAVLFAAAAAAIVFYLNRQGAVGVLASADRSEAG